MGENVGYSDKVGRDYEVTSIIKPNLKFDGVVENVSELCKTFTKQDCVIVLASTNNFNYMINYDFSPKSCLGYYL